jgi:3-oxoacyl-[acyl-carrier-protein] synthase II
MPGQIVVTGLGVISPIGIGVSEFLESGSGRPFRECLQSRASTRFPWRATVRRSQARSCGFAPERYLDSVQGRTSGPVCAVCAGAAQRSIGGLRPASWQKENPRRIGVIVGAGMGGMVMVRTGNHPTVPIPASASRPSEFHSRHYAELCLRHVAMATGHKGPNYTIRPPALPAHTP